jgi:hypothetical protein
MKTTGMFKNKKKIAKEVLDRMRGSTMTVTVNGKTTVISVIGTIGPIWT